MSDDEIVQTIDCPHCAQKGLSVTFAAQERQAAHEDPAGPCLLTKDTICPGCQRGVRVPAPMLPIHLTLSRRWR